MNVQTLWVKAFSTLIQAYSQYEQEVEGRGFCSVD
jgi:hypothetical protein